jgi:hypothetical protein
MPFEVTEFACGHDVTERAVTSSIVRQEMLTGALKMTCLFGSN